MTKKEEMIKLVAEALDCIPTRDKNGCYPEPKEHIANYLIKQGVSVNKNYSEILFKNVIDMFSNNIGVIKVIYNGKIVWDDDWNDCKKKFFAMMDSYGENCVYFFNANIVHFHHCELNIVGE